MMVCCEGVQVGSKVGVPKQASNIKMIIVNAVVINSVRYCVFMDVQELARKCSSKLWYTIQQNI